MTTKELCNECRMERYRISPTVEMSFNLTLFLISCATIGLYSGVKDRTEFAWVYAVLATLVLFYSFAKTLKLTHELNKLYEWRNKVNP